MCMFGEQKSIHWVQTSANARRYLNFLYVYCSKIWTESESSKNLASVQMVSDRNCMQAAVQIKSDKNNFTCIQCADKNVLKHERNRVYQN